MRQLVVWVPDWPALVALADRPADTALAVFAKGIVLACTPQARANGVRRGMRRRDAQSRCPDLVVVDHRAEVDAKAFDEVLTVIDQFSPTVSLLRPGLAALTVPEKFYGGEAEAAAILTELLVDQGVWDVRIGIADGVFVAELAARQAATQELVIVPPGKNFDYLRDLPVEVLDIANAGPEKGAGLELVTLLRRLGLHRLGDFAALAAADVLARFGPHGLLLHSLASGVEPRTVGRRVPPPELTAAVSFEPPLERSDAVVFSCRQSAEGFISALDAAGSVCVNLRIEVDTEAESNHGSTGRVWRHPRWFSSTDVLDRLRWQLLAEPPAAPVVAVRFVPVQVESIGDHAEGLFGGGPNEQVERSLARIQALVGPEGVRSVGVQGGRGPADRRLSAPWGELAVAKRPRNQPWPGSVPAPAPATVFANPQPAKVVGAAGAPVRVSGRGAVSAAPAQFQPADSVDWQPVAAWAGPWPVDEQWWDEAAARRIARFQVVGVDGSAWLMVVENGQWWTEARYD